MATIYITIPLEYAEALRLFNLADSEFRSPRQQARLLLLKGLKLPQAEVEEKSTQDANPT